MLLRANTLAKGNSGARIETVELLLDCLNRGVLPRVPARGSVGASGDLAPLAHLALPLVGEGSAWHDGKLLPGDEALRSAGLEPLQLVAKEGLSLINGTQFMAAQGALGLVRAQRLAGAADCACALSLEALQGSRNSFLPQIQALRPLKGQGVSAANVLRLIEGSAINESHRWCDKVQDAYSLRCAPQVHGASRDLLDYGAYTMSAYDAATIEIAAIKKAIDAGKDPKKINDFREAVRANVAATSNFTGVLGTVTFDQSGDTSAKIISVYAVKKQDAARVAVGDLTCGKAGGANANFCFVWVKQFNFGA
jgi:histidine ammonia-lyase